jgi:Cu(I)/Ag(I) efflux system membrane fusion protein
VKTSTTVLIAATTAVIATSAGYWWAMQTHAPAGTATPVVSAATPASPKPLYYRNPMGLPDTSPVPKKDPMGMDYIPVYEGEAGDPGAAAGANVVRITPDKVQKLGVRTEAVARRALGRVVRASGRVEPDERRTYAITPKFEGYVERLYVNVTGQAVGKGQPLFDVYSPELVSAQREYAIAMQGVRALSGAGGDAAAGMQQLAESSLQRLRNWDLPSEQVDALANSGEPRRTVTFRSPVAGIVTEKKALQGMRFMPGETLYQVTDLSSVWVVADVFEQDIGSVRPGTRASVTLAAYPNMQFAGTITYVYPTLKAETRTVPVRIELANPNHWLKPAMFAQVELPAGDGSPVLAVPDSAVIDSGTRRIVLVQLQEGRFEPREVKLGARGDRHVQVLEGLKEGEQVVVAANFLIDAESNLRAAIGGLGSQTAQGGSASPSAGSSPAVASPAVASNQAAASGYNARGTVDSIDFKAGTVNLNHGAIASLNWPAMTMEFKVANASLLAGLKPGASVSFEFVERQPGEWVITRIGPTKTSPVTPADKPHTGR